ncbi:MAG: ROK family protein [Spirochaetes bacterium]|nr:ROK family protein [Spirochaetota bacterium]
MEHYLGMDLGGTDVKMGVVDSNGTIVVKQSYPTPVGLAGDKLADYFAECMRKTAAAAGLRLETLAAAGIGAPGLVNTTTGILDFVTNIPSLNDYPLGPQMAKRLNIPVAVDNDVNAMVLAELYYGAARSYRNIVALTVGTGVGGGLIFNGQLYRGSSFGAGEIGHMSIETNGPLCNCGNYGCLERYIGREAIVARFDALYRHKKLPSSIDRHLEQGAITPRAIAMAAAEGDELSLFVMDEIGRYLGNGLATIVNILNPELIVIGGGIANAGELLLEPARREMFRRAAVMPARMVKVVQAKFLNDAGILGAASLAREGSDRTD